jgi:hypothetical protein
VPAEGYFRVASFGYKNIISWYCSQSVLYNFICS